VVSSDNIASYFGRHIGTGIYSPLYLYYLPVVLMKGNMQELDLRNYTFINKFVLDFEGNPHMKAIFVSLSHPLYSSKSASVYLI